jgi:hypothetical protein
MPETTLRSERQKHCANKNYEKQDGKDENRVVRIVMSSMHQKINPTAAGMSQK